MNGKKWNGIIYKDKLKFEIKEGKGKIKEYDKYGQLIFEGEYLNGNKKGKEYDDNCELIFEGEYLDEKRWNGKIKEYSNTRYRDFHFLHCGNSKLNKNCKKIK